MLLTQMYHPSKSQRPNFLRSYFYLHILSLITLSGCVTEKMDNHEFQLETYALNELTYPEPAVEIPSSMHTQFVQNFFAPWNTPTEKLLQQMDSVPGKNLSYLETYLKDDAWYGENKKPHTKWQREEIVQNVTIEDFPNLNRKGIVIAHTNLRRLPTHRPGFDTYSKAGEGFPFDYFQDTSLWANTPVLIAHSSKDKQWAYVISPYYKGWVPMRDLAFVDDSFTKKWKNGRYCMPQSDSLNLTSETSNFAINAKMGMVLPYDELLDDSNAVEVFWVNADENLNATIKKAKVSKNEIAFAGHSFDKTNLEKLIANLVGRPYGWGGYLENRDCSSMIRDLLGTFQIWLPRDSKDQVLVGNQYDMSGSSIAKSQLIKDKGVPFLTILRKKGHNMLYVGNDSNGEPLILHAIWGLKTTYSNAKLEEYLNAYPIEGIHKDTDGTLKGRYVIGEAIISSIHLGDGNNGITLPLVDEMYALTNILVD